MNRILVYLSKAQVLLIFKLAVEPIVPFETIASKEKFNLNTNPSIGAFIIRRAGVLIVKRVGRTI